MTYQTPYTSWAFNNTVVPADMNRIETNIGYLKNPNRSLVQLAAPLNVTSTTDVTIMETTIVLPVGGVVSMRTGITLRQTAGALGNNFFGSFSYNGIAVNSSVPLGIWTAPALTTYYNTIYIEYITPTLLPGTHIIRVIGRVELAGVTYQVRPNSYILVRDGM